VVKTVTFPRQGRPSYLRGVRLAAGPHKALFATLPSTFALVGVSSRVHGGTTWRSGGPTKTFTMRRNGTYDFKFTSPYYLGSIPDTLQVTIW
jgi:hypothetical protein